MEKPAKDLRQLRCYAADRHDRCRQDYDPGVPYWIHLLITELIAIAFALPKRVRRTLWAHDLKEDTGAAHTDLREAGWSTEEVDDAERVTDEPGTSRAERKHKTVPKTARGGFFSIAPKLCDRGANLIYGLLSGNVGSHKKYKKEHPALKHYLLDTTDPTLLPLWYFLDSLLARRPKPMTAEEFAESPLKKLIEKWKANKEFILNADKKELLPLWIELKAALDAQYK